MVAVDADKLNAVSFQHCGACGWHYRFYAHFDDGEKVYLGIQEDAIWSPDFGEYGTRQAHEAARLFLNKRAAGLLAKMLDS